MKKLWAVTTVAFCILSVMVAFAAEPIPVNPYDADSRIEKLSGQVAQLRKQQQESDESRLLMESVIADGVSVVAGSSLRANKKLDRLQETGDKIGIYAREAALAARSNKDNLLFVLVVILIALVLLGLFIRRRGVNQHEQTERVISRVADVQTGIGRVATAADKSVTTVTAAIKELREHLSTKIDEIPEKISELNPDPFTFSVAGHIGTYYSPPEGIANGYYLTLMVEDMPDGPDNPATFVRQQEHKRYVVANYVTGMMKKFLEGKLKGTPEEKLILHLVGTKEITYRKIS